MGDYVVLSVDCRAMPQIENTASSKEDDAAPATSAPFPCAVQRKVKREGMIQMTPGEEEPLIQMECRICQEEDHVKNLESPCACSGSLKYAHRACLQRWCNEKRDTKCEICHEPYKPGYTVQPRALSDETTIDIRGGWTITGTPLDLNDHRILAMAAAQNHIIEVDFEEYPSENASSATLCRYIALILMALLLLRNALAATDEDDDTSAIFSLFLLRAAGFLLPFYIMAWVVSILQRRRQRQEAAALSAAEIAFYLHSGQRRGLHFTVEPDSPVTPQQEPRH